jgi:hypothetical protein
MNSISGFNSNYTNPYANATGGASRRADGDGGGHHHHGGGRIGGAFSEALQQTGLSRPAPSTQAGGNGTSQTGENSQNADVSQAYQQFARTLFQALGDQNQQAGASQSAGQHNAQGEHGPGKLAQNLQSLLQQISSTGTDGSTSTTGGSAAASLNDAFNNLAQALGNANSADKPPTLQAFLENFLQDVQTGGHAGTTGLAVNTAV